MAYEVNILLCIAVNVSKRENVVFNILNVVTFFSYCRKTSPKGFGIEQLKTASYTSLEIK